MCVYYFSIGLSPGKINLGLVRIYLYLCELVSPNDYTLVNCRVCFLENDSNYNDWSKVQINVATLNCLSLFNDKYHVVDKSWQLRYTATEDVENDKR